MARHEFGDGRWRPMQLREAPRLGPPHLTERPRIRRANRNAGPTVPAAQRAATRRPD